MKAIKIWAAQIRVPFLLLSVMLVLIGGGVAHQHGVFDALAFWLSLIGVTLAHVAVNLFNEHSDDSTGIDHQTERTPFSGGTGMIQSGQTSARAVQRVAWATLIIALGLGLYLSWRAGYALLLFIVAGGLATRFYTTHLARWTLGELAAGLCLGTFVVLGSYYAQAGGLNREVVLVSIPPGILTALLLLLNELPDMEPDRRAGRRQLAIVLGRRKTALLYLASILVGDLLLVAGVAAGLLPATVLLALLTLPLGLLAFASAFNLQGSAEQLVRGLGANVGLVLGTDFLLALAYFIA